MLISNNKMNNKHLNWETTAKTKTKYMFRASGLGSVLNFPHWEHSINLDNKLDNKALNLCSILIWNVLIYEYPFPLHSIFEPNDVRKSCFGNKCPIRFVFVAKTHSHFNSDEFFSAIGQIN